MRERERKREGEGGREGGRQGSTGITILVYHKHIFKFCQLGSNHEYHYILWTYRYHAAALT